MEMDHIAYAASTDNLKCFECGNIGHKRFTCPPKKADVEQQLPVDLTDIVHHNDTSDIEDNTEKTQDERVSEKPIKRPLEEVHGHKDVSKSDDGMDVERSEKAECSSALVINDDVVEVKENEFVTQTAIEMAEKCSVGELDGLCQCTDDSMKDDGHWSEGSEMSKIDTKDLYTVGQINYFLDETKGKKA